MNRPVEITVQGIEVSNKKQKWSLKTQLNLPLHIVMCFVLSEFCHGNIFWHSRHFVVTEGKLSGTLEKQLLTSFCLLPKPTPPPNPSKTGKCVNPFNYLKDTFPTLSYTSTQEIPALLCTQSLKKGLPGKGHYGSAPFPAGESIYWYSCIHTYIHTLLQLPTRVFQLQKYITIVLKWDNK